MNLLAHRPLKFTTAMPVSVVARRLRSMMTQASAGISPSLRELSATWRLCPRGAHHFIRWCKARDLVEQTGFYSHRTLRVTRRGYLLALGATGTIEVVARCASCCRSFVGGAFTRHVSETGHRAEAA